MGRDQVNWPGFFDICPSSSPGPAGEDALLVKLYISLRVCPGDQRVVNLASMGPNQVPLILGFGLCCAGEDAFLVVDLTLSVTWG